MAQVWAVFFFTTIFSLTCWGGILGKTGLDEGGALVSGCIGMALSSLAFYYIPQHFGPSFAMALIPAIALGIFVAAFVPLAAVFRRWKHKGAAISVYNLSAGISNFLAPAIAVVLLVLQHHRGGDRLYQIVRGGLFSSAPLSAWSSRGSPQGSKPPASRLEFSRGNAAGMRFMPALMME